MSSPTAACLGEEDRRLLATAGLSAVTSVRPVPGGFGNDVLQVADGRRTVALRRWTRDPATAVLEVGALAEAAADGIPVPEVLAASADRAVLSWVDGTRADEVLTGADPDTARAVGRLLGELSVRVAERARPGAGPVTFDGGVPTVRPWPAPAAEMLRDLVAAASEAPQGWAELALSRVDEVAAMDTGSVRVHSDLNPKNVLLLPSATSWRVAALLDWEFTFAGPAEVDIGNLLRFEPRDRSPCPFGRGVRDGLGGLDDSRLHRARALDLFALCGFLTPGHTDNPVRAAVHRLAAHQLHTDHI